MISFQNIGVWRSFQPAGAQAQSGSGTKLQNSEEAGMRVDDANLSAAASLLAGPSNPRIPELKAAVESGSYKPASSEIASAIVTVSLRLPQ
jgi:anti-sigma28 factor (negative regulator of flagellin synthesis)